MMQALESVARLWSVANAAIGSAGLSVALVLVAGILAGAGGMVSGRMRLYGAIVGGMLVNVAVKAMGGGFEAAAAAMAATTTAGFLLGSTPFLVALAKRTRRR